ncbi:MAG: hypothetical protein KatS3mg105_2018 [Gemmatales bacterium]|nr:MAG: hypothetical protein KatS3mg105_2018 [Gemmatales bacterium]
MSASSTTAQFIEILEKADLLPPTQLAEVKSLQDQYPHAGPLAKELVHRGLLTRYQAGEVLAGRATQLVVGPYVVLDRITKGSGTSFYRARHNIMKRDVALKVFPQGAENDPELRREIEIAGVISHPNIVHALEAGPIGSVMGLVMEFVEGKDLKRLVEEEGKLPVSQACDYIRQAALGLQYAHERGLVHRHLKPSKLMVEPAPEADPTASPWGTVKILGLISVGARTPTEEDADYRAPEQANDYYRGDARSDVYSLGCILFFLLSRRPPFPGGTVTDKFAKHQTIPPPVDQLRVPNRLRRIIQRMLHKDPELRYQSAAEVAKALEPFCQPPTTAQRWQQLRLFRMLARLPWFMRYSLGALLLGAFIFLGIRLLQTSKTAKTPPSQPTTDSPPAIPGLIAYFKLDDGKGDMALDSSGNGCHGKLVGNPLWTEGKFGGGLQFKGGEDRVIIENLAVNLKPQAKNTVAFWMKWNGRGNVMPFGWNGSYALYLNAGFFGFNTGEAGNVYGVPDKNLKNEWVHVVAVFPNDTPSYHTAALYLNGIKQDIRDCTRPTSAVRSATPTAVLSGNGKDPHYRFHGILDEVRIYNRPLKEKEIQTLFQLVPETPPESPKSKTQKTNSPKNQKTR